MTTRKEIVLYIEQDYDAWTTRNLWLIGYPTKADIRKTKYHGDKRVQRVLTVWVCALGLPVSFLASQYVIALPAMVIGGCWIALALSFYWWYMCGHDLTCSRIHAVNHDHLSMMTLTYPGDLPGISREMINHFIYDVSWRKDPRCKNAVDTYFIVTIDHDVAYMAPTSYEYAHALEQEVKQYAAQLVMEVFQLTDTTEQRNKAEQERFDEYTVKQNVANDMAKLILGRTHRHP